MVDLNVLLIFNLAALEDLPTIKQFGNSFFLSFGSEVFDI